MNWKEFFIPDLWKFILAVIIVTLGLYISYSTSWGCPVRIGVAKEAFNCTTYVQSNSALPQFNCGYCQEKLTAWDFIYGSMLNIVFPLLLLYNLSFEISFLLVIIYYYFISCLIVYAVRKLKKSHKKLS